MHKKMRCTSGKILRVKKEKLEIKKHCNSHEEYADRLVNRLGMAEDRISEFENISTETSKSEKQRVRLEKVQ